MIDLIITPATFGPAELFTRNFRVHAGIPIGLYREGPRAPVALVYGDVSEMVLEGLAEHYRGLVAIPWSADDAIPDSPAHYETMTVKAPILATLQRIEREGFATFMSTHEGEPFVLLGQSDGTPTLLFTADLVKATIRILSGELERTTGTDRHGRHCPAPDSVISTPGVSLHFNLIANALSYLFKKLGLPLLSIPRWPDSAPMAVFLSHDIDTVRKWTPRRTASELLHGIAEAVRLNPAPLVKTIQSVRSAHQGRDSYWMYDEVLFMEESGGYASTWFFAPFGGEYARRGSQIDPVYRRSPAEITAMIRRLVERGCEVALHGTRGAFLEDGTLRRQLASFEHRLGFKLMGVRHHYLMFRHDSTLEAAASAGLAYDATLGFSDRPGFRNGVAAPFFPFPSNHQAGGILEIPLTFMDTFFINSDDDPDQAERRVTEAYLYARAAGGLFSMLVHPENLGEEGFPSLDRFYKSLIPRFMMDRARALTGAGLAAWWTAREKVLKGIESAPGAWRIHGVNVPPGMEFCVTAPDMASRRFSVSGDGGSRIDHDTLTLSPDGVDPERGLTITMSD